MGLFDSELCEVEVEGVRYILQRNPIRAHELACNHQDKRRNVKEALIKKIDYLSAHPRAGFLLP